MAAQLTAWFARRSWRARSLALSLALVVLSSSPVAIGQAGQTISVADGDVAGFITAIQTLNANGGGTISLANGGAYSVTAPSDWWYGPNAFPAISSAITIDGNGATISRASGSTNFRFFYVSGGFSTLAAGSLTLNDLTLSGGLAQGGSGGGGLEGGGGGGGFGGAIYNQGVLSLAEVTFASNTAQGGSGGNPIGGQTAGGGGGGMGGNGGTSQGSYGPGGGGGGGFKGNGANSTAENSQAGGVGGSFLANEGGGSCSAGGASAYGGNGGNSGGSNDQAGGGGGGFMHGENGGNARLTAQGLNTPALGGAGAIGGGAGGNASSYYGVALCGGSGGAFGGGGAGAPNLSVDEGGGGGGVGGGGGAGGGAGNGGFGGGGGANGGGQDQGGSGGFVGGNGGFGGGGGGVGGNGATGGGQGGFGGGEGTQQNSAGDNYGGGGAGFGGAIFNHVGTVYAVSSTFTGNSAVGGTGANDGDGFGGAIFNLNGTVGVSTATYSGNTATKGGVADEGNFVYNISSNDGNTAAGQIPNAAVVIVNTTIASPTGDLLDNPVNGVATIDSDASGAIAAVTPGWLAFPSLPVGATSLPQPVTLTNIGNAPLTISGIGVSDGAILGINGCGATLAAGASCTVYVSLMAGSAAAVQAELTFTDSSLAASTQTVTLSGTGTSQTAATQLAFVNGLPATTWAGQAALVDVLEETSTGAQQYASAGTITLTITGPNSYSQTYTAAAVNGLASFNLLGGLPAVPGVYSFSATAAGLSTAMDGTTVVVPTVGTSTGSSSVTVNFAFGGTLNSVQVTTSGSPNADFTRTGGGSCAVGTLYSAGQSCTVSVNLIPQATGQRVGGVVLLDPNGNALGTSYTSAFVAGAQIAFDPGVAQQIPGSYSYPSAVSVDGHGDVFVAGLGQYAIGAGTEQIIEAQPNAGSYSSSTLSGPQSAWGAALDGAGNLFVTFAPLEENGAVIEYPWNGQSFGAGISIASGVSGYWNAPTAVTVDAAGNLYVIDGLLVEKLPWTGVGYGPGIQIVPGILWQPVGIAVDSQGNVYVADSYNDEVVMVPWNNLGTTSPTPINGNFTQVNNVALDGNGNLFTADAGNGAISRFLNLGGGTFGAQSTVMSGLNQPEGLAVDALGNLYLTAAYSNQVWKVNYATPPAFSFPTQTKPGTVDTADGPRTARITNIGNAPLQFLPPSAGANPSYPANFPVNANDTNLCSSAAQVSVGSSCDVSANFMPAAGGANTGSVVLTDNALNVTSATQSIALSGTGIVQDTPATITSPAASAVFSGPSVAFAWTTAPGATGYYLWIGSTGVGSNNLYNSAPKSATSYTFTGMPTNGETIYVRLITNYNGTWVHNDYVYTAATQAAMTSPVQGASFAGPSATFSWTSATTATGYYLWIGSTGVGSSNLYYSALKNVTSYTFTAMPTNGETIYVRLTTNYSGAWVHTDYTYTAAAQALLSSPTAGSSFTGTSVTFTWSAAPNATDYYLLIGTTGVGSNNLYNSAPKTVTSYTFNGMPTNGETIYVRLTTNFSGTWLSKDYIFKAEAIPAAITAPAAESAFTGLSATFTWTTPSGATGYYLWIGTTGVGSNNLYNSEQKTVNTYTFSGLPTNGEPVYVRLITNYNGTWVSKDYTYTAAAQAVITSPALGSVLPGASVTFTWSAAANATGYYLQIGSTGIGSENIYNSALKTVTTYTYPSMPTNGETIYVRLTTDYNGTWVHNDYQFTAAE